MSLMLCCHLLLLLLLPPGLPLSNVSEHLNMLLEAAKVAKSPTPGETHRALHFALHVY
jgi:hypothetical protein